MNPSLHYRKSLARIEQFRDDLKADGASPAVLALTESQAKRAPKYLTWRCRKNA